jgi:uncharacterized membrane protein YbaN (DUF454 family)
MHELLQELATRGSPTRWGLFMLRGLFLVLSFVLFHRANKRLRESLGVEPGWRQVVKARVSRPALVCAGTYIVLAFLPVIAQIVLKSSEAK